MPLSTFNLEWLNHNSLRAYPLTADATQTDATGSFTLPKDLLVGMSFPVHFGVSAEPAKFFVKSLGVYATGLQLVLGYAGSGGDVDVASALVAYQTHTENKVYPLIGIGDFADGRGHVVVGSLAGLSDQPAGLFEFDLADGRLEPDVIKPSIRTISALQFQNGSVRSDELYGHVVIRAGRNTRFRVVTASGQPTRVIWDAIDGEGLTETCVCSDDLSDPIRTVSNVGPDGAGNLRLIGNDCLTVSGLGNGLQLKDICSEPCCGCKELEAVTAALESFGERATTLENFLVSLEARVTEMDLTVLGSRLGDRGCTPAQECP